MRTGSHSAPLVGIVAGVSLLAAFGLWLPAFYSPFATGFGDWQFFHHMWEAGYVALVDYGEWPLWDPFHCGGITIFGNPQNQSLSPFYALAFLAGPTLGSKLFVLLHAWAGFAGMYLLARREGLQLLGAVLASVAWAASGFFVSHGSGGHSAFMPFYFAPWLLICWRAAVNDVRYAVAVAALMTLVLLEGGVYPFPYFILLLAFDVVVRLCLRQRVRGALIAAAVAVPLGALLGSVRLFPIIEELLRHPRNMPSVDGVSLAEILEMLTAREHGWRYAGHEFVWPEYVTYVGWGILSLGLVGVLFAWLDGRRRFVVGVIVFVALTMGDHGAWSVWSLVHRLPVYDSLRVPSRFAVFFTLYLALLAGTALDRLHGWASERAATRKPWTRWLVWIWACGAVVAIVVDLLIVHHPTLNRWTDEPIIKDRVSDHYYLTPLPYGRFYASFPRMHLGSRGCYEAMNFSPARGLWSGDRPQVRVISGEGQLGVLRRTTRRAFFTADLAVPSRVLVNQNNAPGWTSNVGKVIDDDGRLAIDLPAGKHEVALVYTPPTLVISLVLSALGTCIALLLLRFGRRLNAAWQLAEANPSAQASST